MIAIQANERDNALVISLDDSENDFQIYCEALTEFVVLFSMPFDSYFKT